MKNTEIEREGGLQTGSRVLSSVDSLQQEISEEEMQEKLLKDILKEKKAVGVSLPENEVKVANPTEPREILIPMPRLKMVSDKTLRVPMTRPRMTHPQKVISILREIFSDLTDGQEYAYIITLDSKLTFLNTWGVGQGGVDHVVIDRAQVFRRVLATDDASCFIIAHNHPSGDPTPSEEDFAMLEDLKRGALYLERPIRDFIILADGNDKYYSHRDHNYEL